MNWKGVISAMTTAFKPDYAIDHAFVAKHAKWQLDSGCDGIVAPGSLGESATLEFDEKIALLKTLVGAGGADQGLEQRDLLVELERRALAERARRDDAVAAA